jgi:hypothetical protein
LSPCLRRWGLALAIVLVGPGCAVGRFIAGAPSPGSTTPRQALILKRCSGCHQPPDPAAMSADAWRHSLERMRRRIRLPGSEWDSLAAMARDEGP